ncbi:hypothetical protein L198_02489 [Cryptococcus wingfieldii CBS 7118]|uniref:Uncharacterized protein n=1 Tax=Cryptococcus wingfieldii CBS 7118 TaxID=1295528 RepID=A0A1E3JRX5_9TREE|nr:hypothetical protein L198_02489 [Cryptococcus wingfieldii CBS 7118]ODO03638.1 hypothetical protein L198_02489 [Cryptococcus wingfieldii CBS 7118]
MSSITPATFAALHPVHHLIFEELVASAPHSVLRLCSSTYERIIPLLYVDISPSPAVFEGLQSDAGEEWTLEALQNTRTLKICDFTSLDTLYGLTGVEPHSHTIPSPSVPSDAIEAIPRYRHIYRNIFPNLERLEFGFPVLRERVDAYINPHFPEEGRGPVDREKMLFRRIERLLPSNLREVVFHLDEEGEEYWNKARHFLHTLAPRDAVIMIRGKILNRAKTLAAGLGDLLPLSWDRAERLRVFVEPQGDWDSLDYTDKAKIHFSPMGISVYQYASNLYDELAERGWTSGSGQELPKSVPRVEIHLPERARVLQWVVDDDVHRPLDTLLEEGILVLKELDMEVVEKLGVMEWAGVA